MHIISVATTYQMLTRVGEWSLLRGDLRGDGAAFAGDAADFRGDFRGLGELYKTKTPNK